MRPTPVTYSELQQAFDHLNNELFEGKLPDCLITLQREKNTFGYFSFKRFVNFTGNIIDEIAMNPTYFPVIPIVEVMQTLAHEMCHLWQAHNGQPGRGRYHNSEWADKMENIGLMPSNTGKPGGKKTGDQMSDYVIPGGRFIIACEGLITNDFKISWYDRFPSKKQIELSSALYSLDANLPENVTEVPIENGIALAVSTNLDSSIINENKSNRIKYSCKKCNLNVWGKPKLNLVCGECGEKYQQGQ